MKIFNTTSLKRWRTKHILKFIILSSTGMQRTWSRAPGWLSYSGLVTWSYLVRNIFCWWKWLIFSNSSFFFDVTISKQNINGRIIILIICRMRVIMKVDSNLIEQCWSFYYDVCDVGSKFISTWNMNWRKPLLLPKVDCVLENTKVSDNQIPVKKFTICLSE